MFGSFFWALWGCIGLRDNGESNGKELGRLIGYIGAYRDKYRIDDRAVVTPIPNFSAL